MKLTLGAAFSDAAALWRANRDLLLRVAGVFFFLPTLGFGLLIAEAPPAAEGATQEQLQQGLLATIEANLPWILGSAVVQELGVVILFLLLLAPDRPRLGDAMARALRIFPGFLATVIVCGLAVLTGSLLFVVPGLYVQGRTLLAATAFAANPGKGPLDAIEQGVRLSARHGWLLFALWALVFFLSLFGSAIVSSLGGPLVDAAGGLALVDMAVRMAEAAVGAAAALALTLLRVAAYRRLAR